MKNLLAFIGLVLGFLALISIVVWAAGGNSFWIPLQSNEEGRGLILCFVHLFGIIFGVMGITYFCTLEENTFAAVDRRSQERRDINRTHEWVIQNYPTYKKPTPTKLMKLKWPSTE